jgi:hygromycin-B 7''-O-kinase
MTSPRPQRGSPLAELRARNAMRWAGLDAEQPLEPATSATNQVWLTPGHVVRVSSGLTARLAREAAVAQLLPPEVPYPRVVAHGSGSGDDWLICARVLGTPLAHLWPDLDRPTRRAAAADLAAALRALHQVHVREPLPPLERVPHLLEPTHTPLAALREGLERAARLPHVDRGLLLDLAHMLEGWAPALPSLEATTLIHGDLTFENMLHDGDRLSAVLDLEWARPAPIDLDLDVLLRTCAFPELHVAPQHASRADAQDYQPVPAWLAEDHPDLFAADRLLDRLRIYDLAFTLRELLESPPRQRAAGLDPRHSLRRLQRLASGRGHVDDPWVRDALPAGS